MAETVRVSAFSYVRPAGRTHLGAAGVDGLLVAEFKDWLKVHWPSVKQALLEDRYLPQSSELHP
jgi:hypothetical protein